MIAPSVSMIEKLKVEGEAFVAEGVVADVKDRLISQSVAREYSSIFTEMLVIVCV